MNNKPFKGEIYRWNRVYFDRVRASAIHGEDVGLSYVIRGVRNGGPYRTSWVVTHDLTTGMIETRNSFYQLIGREIDDEYIE